MTPLYDTLTKDHALASDFVKRLSDDTFEAQQVLAEMLLGLSTPVITDANVVERLQIAIIQQIDFQVQQGFDPLILESMGVGSQATKSMTWRDRYINPRSAAIVSSLGISVGTWGSGMQSHRTNDGGGHAQRANGGIYRWPPHLR